MACVVCVWYMIVAIPASMESMRIVIIISSRVNPFSFVFC